MKKNNFAYPVTIFLFFFISSIRANEINYAQLTNASGLSNSSVNCILQDSQQIMWFGTWDGLNSFDGKEFKTYKPDPGNPQAISDNNIRNIIEQRSGILWIATIHGINRMNVNNSTFQSYYFGYEKSYPVALPEIYAITKSSDNTVFCSVYEWGLSFYNEEKQDFQAINTSLISTQDIRNIKIDKKDNLWILHKNGSLDITRWERDKKGNIIITECTKNILSNIGLLQYSDNQYILALDENKKIYVYDTSCDKKIVEYDLKKIISQVSILRMEIIDQTLYISPGTGSYYTRTLYGESTPVFNEKMKSIRINFFYKGAQNILWLGTDGDGIYMCYDKNKLFNTIRLTKEQSIVRSFCEDKHKRLWIATKGGGIAVIENYNTPNYKVVAEYNTNNGLLNNSVYTITKAFGEDLFTGSDGRGINVFSRNTLSTIDMNDMPADIPYQIYAIYCSEKDSTLWVGTSEFGLYKIEVTKKSKSYKAIRYKQYLHDKNNEKSLTNNIIYTIVPADDKHLWVGTRGGGLNYFDIEKETFSAFRYDSEDDLSISCNDILYLYKSKNEDLWIGTSAGLNLLKKENKQAGIFIRYTLLDGLPNNTVHGIVEDNSGNIWLSTNKGLAKINRINNQITTYYQYNGLQNNEFSDGACYKSEKDNSLFFGGISGFNIFNHDQISLRNFAPNFHISSFKIFNKEVNMNDRIRTNKKGNEELILTHNENFFSFNFLSIDYIQNESCEYKYMLKGIDKDWVMNGNLGYATYTNVKPGKYKLFVYYTNGDKVWIEKPYTLDIWLKPPFRQTTLAYFFYLLIFTFLCYLTYVIIKRRVSQKRKLLIERMERQEQEKIHEAKLRFFTNIAHEFYTPITLIYGPCEKILEYSHDKYITKYVNIIRSNAERMKHLIRELMEFRKVDTEHAKIIPSKINVTELISGISDSYAEIAEENKIDFKINLPETDIYWISDCDSLEKILFNIISNAFKYTPKEGYIHIDATHNDKMLTFNITNSGKGIKPENIDEIFNRFKILDDFENQMEKGNTGRNGIGLALTKSLVTLLNGNIKVESKPDRFTTFSIELPLLEISLENESETEKEDLAKTTDPGKNAKIQLQQLPSGSDGSPLILIVDDEKEIRDLIRDTLNEKYTNIMEASNGLDALELMKTKRPNLIISDIIMPEMDGIELAKELKSNIFTNHLPIIFLSAKTSVEDQILAAQSGSDIYITKPFHPKHILAAVENILVKHKLIQEYYNSSATAFEMLENGNVIRKEDKELLMKIIRFIEENMDDERLSPAYISEQIGMSKITMYRKIKETVNRTPSEFIKTIKMNHSIYLLLSTNLTVQEIMFRCGFNNKSYFYKEFLKMYHCTPKEYKSKNNPS